MNLLCSNWTKSIVQTSTSSLGNSTAQHLHTASAPYTHYIQTATNICFLKNTHTQRATH